LALFVKLAAIENSSSRSSGKKKKKKKVSKKPVLHPTDSLCHVYHEKGHWASEYPKKDQIKTKHLVVLQI